MDNCVSKRQRLAPLALRDSTAVEPSPSDDLSATVRSAPIARNSPVPAALRELPRPHGIPPADGVSPRASLLVLDPCAAATIAGKLDLDSAKALRLTNRAFRVPGATRFTSADVTVAAEIEGMTQFFRDAENICTLRITDKDNFGDQELQRLVAILPNKGANIRQLDLSGCHLITDAGLTQLSSMSEMQSLNLCECRQITDTGLSHLAGLTAMQSLNFFGSNQITNAGLGQLVNMTKMLALNLGHCGQITDPGLGHLSAMTKMRSLDLFGCSKITDTGLSHLSGMTEMQSLSFFGCKKITDIGLGHLSSMTAIRSLNLIMCTNISEAKVIQLRTRGVDTYWWG